MRLTRALRVLSGKSLETFYKYGDYSPTPLSLKKLSKFAEEGSAVKSAVFLCDELPVRLANIMQELHLLPKTLTETPSASEVNQWYEMSFCDLIEFSHIKWDDKWLEKFKRQLDIIRNRHDNTVETMATGVMEFKQKYGITPVLNTELQYFLDRFYMMRISIRMLINQHLLVFGSELNKERRFIGTIDPDCNVTEILQDAYEDARYLCEHYYMNAPKLDVELCGVPKDGKIEFVYVPSHLYHILFELLKNSLRAVVEFNQKETSLPSVKVLVALGDECVTIKISDQGGGIPHSEMESVFNYTYTTAASRAAEANHAAMGLDTNAKMAGYGYGLPLSRLYAMYFNGNLTLNSVEGFGSDALVYLKRNAADADELLPVFNRTAARQYGSSGIPVPDWSNPQHNSGWRRG